MTFEECIIKESKEKISGLWPQTKVAMSKPDTGVTIKNKSAYFVIRDSAMIAFKYLPLHCYLMMANPVETLSGKITKKMIKEFVAKINEPETKALIRLILIDDDVESTPEMILEPSDENPYGDYGYTEETKTNIESSNCYEELLIKKFCE